MKISILTENRTSKGKFLAEHGLSVFIEFNDMNILFDTGQTDVYCHNASFMGVDLSKTDCIILSHGHYDHCGGYVHFPVKEKYPVTYVREKAFERKLTKDKNGYREIGIPWKYENYKDKIVFTDEKMHIAENIYLCSDIPFTVPFEEPFKGLLVLNGEEKITDRMQDEQMLVIDTEKGLVIFIGCSHVASGNEQENKQQACGQPVFHDFFSFVSLIFRFSASTGTTIRRPSFMDGIWPVFAIV